MLGDNIKASWHRRYPIPDKRTRMVLARFLFLGAGTFAWPAHQNPSFQGLNAYQPRIKIVRAFEVVERKLLKPSNGGKLI